MNRLWLYVPCLALPCLGQLMDLVNGFFSWLLVIVMGSTRRKSSHTQLFGSMPDLIYERLRRNEK